jgi:diguanylate cyclase (GGDEF)-like protein
MSVTLRFAAVLAAILVFAFVATGVINYQVSRESVRREIITSGLPLTRDNIYSEITASLVQPLYVSSTMASDAFLRRWAEQGEQDGDIIRSYLTDIRRRYGYASVFFVSTRTSTYYHQDGILKQVSRDDSHDVWFYRFIDSGLEHDLDVDTNEAANNSLAVFVNCRVVDEGGATIGVTGVALEMDAVAGLLARAQQRYQRRVFLVDSQGLVQAHPDRSMIEKAHIADLPGLKDVADEVLGGRGAPLDLTYRGRHGTVLLTSRYLPELDWFLLVEQDEAGAMVGARRSLVITLLIGVIASVVIAAAGAATAGYFQRRMRLFAVTDELTGAHNRSAFEERFADAQARFARRRETFCVILMDLDRFKQVNDTLGHQAGDSALKTLAGIVNKQIRATDVLSRWGGDEFAVLVGCGLADAVEVANRIRLEAAGAFAAHGATVSAGIAEHRDGGSLDDLMRRADQALYRAKDAGRNAAVADDGP